MSDLKLPDTRRIAGIATTAELIAAGWSGRQIRIRVRRGELCQVGRGLYASGPEARSYLDLRDGSKLLALAGAVAAAGPQAVVSHQSAAYLHSIALLTPDPAVTLTVPPRRGRTARAGVRLHASSVPPGHTTMVGRLAVTTPARTIADLARTLEFRAGVVAADSALHQRLVTKAEVTGVLAECVRWPGLRRAAEVIEFADDRAESPLESIARIAFRDCGLPAPELQVWLGGVAEPVARVDFYWRRHRTIAEVDGALKYANPDRARAQLRRDSLLREDGFEVVHFTWQQITATPEAVAASIRSAFRRGERNAAASGPPG